MERISRREASDEHYLNLIDQANIQIYSLCLMVHAAESYMPKSGEHETTEDTFLNRQRAKLRAALTQWEVGRI